MTHFAPLPFRAPLTDYENEAHKLIAAAPQKLSDAMLAIARSHDFKDWPALTAYVQAVSEDGSPTHLFESAVEAVVNGDLPQLQSLLTEHPELTHARSTRITHFDPPVHHSTLLHYIAANGVEGYRQKTPPNAFAIAKLLLERGAEPDSLASLYGGQCTTLSLLVSSCHPAEAGLQIPLAAVLIDFGASLQDHGAGAWVSPVLNALTFGYRDTALYLTQRGAPVNTIMVTAGLGRMEETAHLLPSSNELDRHRALALAAALGNLDVLRLLLDAGEDPNRYNPEGYHAHSTPLHQAALLGDEQVVRLLLERGAKLDIKDKIYQSTPLGWAQYSGKTQIASYLRAKAVESDIKGGLA